MNTSDVLSQRLHNQKLSSSEIEKPADVVRWLGAVQAQDFSAAKWAIALRMRDANEALIDKEFDEGKIIRTHLLRPTWHFVAPEDIRWLLEFTAPQVNRRSGPNYRKYELDGAVFKRSHRVLSNALRGGKHLTRAALKTALNKSSIAADDTVRMAHLLLRAELDGVVCSGPRVGKQFTYALLDERVPQTKPVPREEALAELTRRYFLSHGPATLQDFIWWSGLTSGDARRGAELVDRHLRNELINEKTYWTSTATPKAAGHSAHLLPAFDEYFVAYKDRQVVPGISNWDLLGPTIIIDGYAAGTWKRTNEDALSLNVLRPLNKSERLALSRASQRYTAYKLTM